MAESRSIVVFVGTAVAFDHYVRELAEQAYRFDPGQQRATLGANGARWEIGNTWYIRVGERGTQGLRGLTGPAQLVVSVTATTRQLQMMPEIEHHIAIMNATTGEPR